MFSLTGGDHGLDAQVLRHLDRDLGGLQRQLSRRHNNHALRMQLKVWAASSLKLKFHLNYVLGGIDLLQAGNSVRSSLSGSVLCSRQDIPELTDVKMVLASPPRAVAHRPERAMGMLAS